MHPVLTTIPDRPTFLARLEDACAIAIAACRSMAIQEVPDAFALLVKPNSSCDTHVREGEVTFPEESLPDGQWLGPMSPVEFVDRFWRSGMIPKWIDVSVDSVTPERAIVQALVCGRFTAWASLLYHVETGRPPFHVTSPALPFDWTPGQRFDVNRRARGPARGG